MARAQSASWRRVAADPALLGAIAAIWILLLLFVLYPMAQLLERAFVDDGGFTLEPLLSTIADASHQAAFVNSLILATAVGVLGTALGFLFALTAVRGGLGRHWLTLLDAAALLPLVSPPFTTSISIIFSFGPKGFITHDLLGLTNVSAYGVWSTTLAETLTYFPIAYLTLRPIVAAIDPNLEEMAFSLGGSRWRIFRTVTLPLAVPGFANAFLLLFAASLADFATPLILAGNSFPVLPTQAYLQITGLFDFKGGAVLSLILLLPAAAVFLLQRIGSAGGPTSRSPARWASARAPAPSRRGPARCWSRPASRWRRSSSISTPCCWWPRWSWRSAPTTASPGTTTR